MGTKMSENVFLTFSYFWAYFSDILVLWPFSIFLTFWYSFSYILVLYDFSDILVLSEQKNLECLKIFLTFWDVTHTKGRYSIESLKDRLGDLV